MESHPTPEECWERLPAHLTRQIDSWKSSVEQMIEEHGLDRVCFTRIDSLVERLTWIWRLVDILKMDPRFLSLYPHVGNSCLFLSRQFDYIDAHSITCAALGSNCFSAQKLWPKRNQFLAGAEWRAEVSTEGDMEEILAYLNEAVETHLLRS